MIARRASRSCLDRPRLESIPVPRPRRSLRTLTLGLVLVAIVWTALRLAWALGGVIGGGW